MTKAFLLIAAMLAAPAPAFAGDLVINLAGVEAGKGDLYVGLQTKDEFLKTGGSYGVRVAAPSRQDQRIVIPNVKPGEYSVGVWQDIDGDGRFSRAPNGVPLDGWSMVGARQLRGVPQWDQTKISVGTAPSEVSLSMVYPSQHH